MQTISRTNQFWHNSYFFVGAFLVALALIWQIVEQSNHNRQLQLRQQRNKPKLIF